jgi:hypothetical protein
VDVSSRSAEEFVGSFDICLKKKMNDKSCLWINSIWLNIRQEGLLTGRNLLDDSSNILSYKQSKEFWRFNLY